MRAVLDEDPAAVCLDDTANDRETESESLNCLVAAVKFRKDPFTFSGIDSADQASSMYLVELALDFVRQALAPRGDFVVKVFQGAGSDAYIKDVRSSFAQVFVRKPAASRPRSREVYLVAKGFKG